MISSYQYQNISHHSIICALKWNNRESKQLLPQLSATQISSTTSNMILAEFRLIPCSWDGILTETYPFLTFDISRSVFSYLESRDFSFSFYPHAVLGKNSHQQKQQIQLEMIYPKVCSNIVSRTVLAIGSKNLCCVVKRGTGGKPPWTYPGIGDTQRLPTSQWPRNVCRISWVDRVISCLKGFKKYTAPQTFTKPFWIYVAWHHKGIHPVFLVWAFALKKNLWIHPSMALI